MQVQVPSPQMAMPMPLRLPVMYPQQAYFENDSNESEEWLAHRIDLHYGLFHFIIHLLFYVDKCYMDHLCFSFSLMY